MDRQSTKPCRWKVTLIGKKDHRHGVIEARDEREATAKVAEEFVEPAHAAMQDRSDKARGQ
jgi:hypothetical protein